MGNVRVRDGEPTDAAVICELFNAMIATSTVAWRDEPTSEPEQREWLAERQARGQPTLVAEEGGAVVGYCCWTSFRGGNRFPGYLHTVEHTIHVRADRQGQGIGRRLMRELIDRARAADVHVMVAAVDGDNGGSIAFHAGLGFVEVARMPQTGRKFGRWLDLVLMQRILGPDDDAAAMSSADHRDAVLIARSMLDRLSAAVAARDAASTGALFEPDCLLVGTAGHALTSDARAAYIDAVVTQPGQLSWDWADVLVSHADARSVVFLARGDLVLTDKGAEDRAPIRLSGVLRRVNSGPWRFAHFHGSTPGT